MKTQMRLEERNAKSQSSRIGREENNSRLIASFMKPYRQETLVCTSVLLVKKDAWSWKSLCVIPSDQLQDLNTDVQVYSMVQASTSSDGIPHFFCK